MERSEYEEYLDFKDFLRLRQAASSGPIGEAATRKTMGSGSKYRRTDLNRANKIRIYEYSGDDSDPLGQFRI